MEGYPVIAPSLVLHRYRDAGQGLLPKYRQKSSGVRPGRNEAEPAHGGAPTGAPPMIQASVQTPSAARDSPLQTAARVSAGLIAIAGRQQLLHRMVAHNASVPFWFDVHAMLVSDNAPALEAKLHERFSAGRLNKINGRKEFFHPDISEIEAVIRENYDAAVEVTHEAPAEQYRESLRMELPKGCGSAIRTSCSRELSPPVS